jgi:hypothetical protein
MDLFLRSATRTYEQRDMREHVAAGARSWQGHRSLPALANHDASYVLTLNSENADQPTHERASHHRHTQAPHRSAHHVQSDWTSHHAESPPQQSHAR